MKKSAKVCTCTEKEHKLVQNLTNDHTHRPKTKDCPKTSGVPFCPKVSSIWPLPCGCCMGDFPAVAQSDWAGGKPGEQIGEVVAEGCCAIWMADVTPNFWLIQNSVGEGEYLQVKKHHVPRSCAKDLNLQHTQIQNFLKNFPQPTKKDTQVRTRYRRVSGSNVGGVATWLVFVGICRDIIPVLVDGHFFLLCFK